MEVITVCTRTSFFGVDDFDPFPDLEVDDFDPFPDLEVEVVDEDQIFDDASTDSYELDE